MAKKLTRKRRIIQHLGNITVAAVSLRLVVFPVQAEETGKLGKIIKKTLNRKSGEEILGEVLKVVRGKLVLSIAATIVCGACISAAGVVYGFC
jgi:uncharacterized protein (DUF697 family)